MSFGACFRANKSVGTMRGGRVRRGFYEGVKRLDEWAILTAMKKSVMGRCQ